VKTFSFQPRIADKLANQIHLFWRYRCPGKGATARKVATPIGVNSRESNPYSASHATTTKQKPELYQEVKQYMMVLFNALY
jgi:hypothetical protein